MRRFKLGDLSILILPLIIVYIGMSIGDFPISEGINLMAVALALSFGIALLAFFFRYLDKFHIWYVLLGVPFIAAFIITYFLPLPVSIFTVFLQTLGISLGHYLFLRLFYYKPLMRIRLIICSLLGAGAFASFYFSLHHMVGLKTLPGFWMQSFYTGFILYLSVFFALSMADLIIIKREVKTLKKQDADEDA